jgi:hypothetical protein
VFVIAGVEKVRLDTSLSGSVLDLYQMPYTHSLPAALLWAVGSTVLLKVVLRLPTRAAVALGLVVFSHWILDLLVHRPDLELWFGGEKVGLGLWNYPVPEMAFEMGLVVLAGGVWIAARKSSGLAAWPGIALLGLLIAMQIGFLVGPIPSSTAQMGLLALMLYSIATSAAWLVDRHDRRTIADVNLAPGRSSDPQ